MQFLLIGIAMFFSGCGSSFSQGDRVHESTGGVLESPIPLPDEEVLREEILQKEKQERGVVVSDLSEARVLADGSWELGSPEVPLVLRLYTDYQCEYCSEFARRTESRILEEFVDQGLVRYQVAMFPLEKVHEHALFAASAALCAGEQGKFFEMHRKLLGNYFDLGYWHYRKYADEIGLDRAAFLSCYKSERFVDVIRAQKGEGQSRGVEAVPTLFIGEKRVEGVYPFGDVRHWMETEARPR